VRPVVSQPILPLTATEVALVKLNHVMAGLYMCVRLHIQECGWWYKLNSQN